MSADEQARNDGGGDSDSVELVEENVPLAGIADEVADLVELYGGKVTARHDGAISFTLPSRRGVIASGGFACELSWTGEGEHGTLRLVSGEAVEGPSVQHIALLVAGVAGSLVCILWPFFPSLTPAAGIGAVLAIGAYLLTLRRSSANVAADLLRRLVIAQGEKVAAEAE